MPDKKGIFICLVVLCGVPLVVNGQSNPASVNEFPFQIIHAEKAKGRNNRPFQSLDLVASNDTITVESGGSVAMIHYNGLPIEFNRDTTLAIKNLLSYIVKIRETKMFKGHIERPDLEFLYITKSSDAKRKLLSQTQGINDGGNYFQAVFPPTGPKSYPIYYQGSFCLKWVSKYPYQTVQVTIRNIFDEMVKRIVTAGQELRVEKEEIEKWGYPQWVVEVTDTRDKNVSSTMVFREYPITGSAYPFTCVPEKASYALAAGLNLEMASYGTMPAIVEEYFVLATKLSDNAFYEEMLENFRRRRE